MPKTSIQPETKVIFVSRFIFAATAIFNGNCFPESVRREVEVCANRFALFLNSSTLMTAVVQKDLSEFISTLRTHADELESASKSRPDLKVVAYIDGLNYLMILHTILYSLKSFLDVFALLVCKLVNPSTAPMAFKKAVVDGRELSGAKLARWVERSSPGSFSEKLRLTNLILSHSREWISDAVDYRDTLAHRREIQGMELMSVPISAAIPPFAPENVRLPRLPNGKLLDTYCSELVAKLGMFLDAVMPLLPKVKMEMVEPWQSSQRYIKE